LSPTDAVAEATPFDEEESPGEEEKGKLSRSPIAVADSCYLAVLRIVTQNRHDCKGLAPKERRK
jgi:hypothetical protein